ncbi:MAG: hypothetical protein KDE51_19195, partial [Anaerolineales bacterium]|nr:hypothetical protein [Anaerolineales bacterium]
MKSVYQIPFVIALFIGMALNVGALVAIFNWEEFTWQVVSLLCILVALLIDLYLLGAAFSKKFVSAAAFYISLCAEIGLVAVLYLLYSMQQIELLLWLYFGLVILWHLISILILGMSIFDQSHFWVRMRKRIEPVNLLVLSFTFLLFTPFFYELYSRFDYESQREIAITTALQ